MGKYLVLVEIDIDDVALLTTVEDIGDIGEHVTVEKAVNLESVERKGAVRVKELVWGPDDTYPQVSVQPFKFKSGQLVDVILLPGDEQVKERRCTH